MRTYLQCSLSLVALFMVAGCSSDAGTSCDSSDDCPRTEACTSDGVCGEVACSSNDDCFNGGNFTEACLREDADGNFDPSADGLCSHQECRGDRDCESGQTCRDGICYNGTAGPLPCSCREDCLSGEACIAGTCGAPLGACNTDCECPLGQTCGEGGMCESPASDPCAGVECPEGQECVEGTCTDGGGSACDPPCADGQVCNEATGVCETPIGSLCSPCTEDAECGGAGNLCVPIGPGGNICGRACGTQADCPDSYVCRAPGPDLPNQCLPLGGQCGGCMLTGCDVGEFCDPSTVECTSLVATCESCSVDLACGDGAICASVAGQRVCVDVCAAGTTCEVGYTCGASGRPDVQACLPDGGSCGGGSGCINECPEGAPFQDPLTCTCTECRTTDDCEAGLICSDVGSCIVDGGACGSAADCPGGYCQGGVCVECLTPADCDGDDICLDGTCTPCPCPEGQSCDFNGECVEVADPSSCTSDTQCLQIAIDLGYGSGDYACDPDIGCFTIGTCNGALGGIDLGGLGFGGTTDPFNAPCSASTTCEVEILGGGGLFGFSCQGCVDGDDSTCREGEACSAPLLPLFGDTPTCGADTGGGFLPGFP